MPEAVLFVGKNRVLNAERAVYHEADLILLDDGMQYRSLHRDVEIVMLHGDDLYGKRADRLYLHAEQISFEHPVTKKRLTFNSEPEF